MSDAFDPYYKWLGIPPKDQPPNHYRLLGISVFEDDIDVIDNATQLRKTFVKKYKSGEHAELARKILDEINAASVGLLDPTKKAAYDAQLSKQLEPDPPDAVVPSARLIDEPSEQLPHIVTSSPSPQAEMPTITVDEEGPAAPRKKRDTKKGTKKGKEKLGVPIIGLPNEMPEETPDPRQPVQDAAPSITISDGPSRPQRRKKDTKKGAKKEKSDVPIITVPDEKPSKKPQPKKSEVPIVVDSGAPVSASLTDSGQAPKITIPPAVPKEFLEEEKKKKKKPRLLWMVLFGGLLITAGVAAVFLLGDRIWEYPGSDTNKLKPGLRAEIYDGTDFEKKLTTRIDPQVDFDWDNDPPGEDLPKDNFSIRWTGWLKAPKPGSYRLVVRSDDGVRLWLDDNPKPLIDEWHSQSARTFKATVQLTDKPHKLKIEYFDAGQDAVIRFHWAPENDEEEQPVPAEALFHSE